MRAPGWPARYEAELERIHDGDALFALADTIVEVSPIEAERCLQAVIGK